MQITELENDKRREQEHNRQLLQQLRNDKEEEKPKSVPMEGVEEDISTQSSDAAQQVSNPDPRFQKLLDLRKRLRRSVFKDGNEVSCNCCYVLSQTNCFFQYADDTSAIMKQVEEFEDVTFELVKASYFNINLSMIIGLTKQFTTIGNQYGSSFEADCTTTI